MKSLYVQSFPIFRELSTTIDYQIPVTQLKGPKGDGDVQAAKRDCNAPPTRYLNIWLCGRQTVLSVMGVGVGVANFFLVQSIGTDETKTFQLKSVF